ncbi:hypothetical protein HHX47_DHR8000303 [Lentinula edodes]|nr:hypothetical protein HHX47_DHR8000303 [Lentinula edodes]
MRDSAIYSYNPFKALQNCYILNASNLTAAQSLAHHEISIRKTIASTFLTFSGETRIKDVCRNTLRKEREHLSEADIDIATNAFGSRLVLNKILPTGCADQLTAWFGSPECSLIEGELESLARRVMSGTARVFKQTYQKGKRPSSGDSVEGAAATKKATGLKGIFGASEAKGNRKPLAELQKDKNQSNAPQPPVFVAPQSNRSSGHPQARPLSRSAPNSHRHAIYIDNDVSANNLAPPRPDNITTNEAAPNVSGSDTAPSSVAAQMLQPNAVNNVVAPPHPGRVSGPSSQRAPNQASASGTLNVEEKKGEAQVSMPVPDFSTTLKPVNDSKPIRPAQDRLSPKLADVTTLCSSTSEDVIAKSNQESSPQSTPFVTASSSDVNTISEGKSTIVIDAASGDSSVSESEQDNATQDSSTAESSTSAFTFSDPSTMARNISSSNNVQPLVFNITYNHTHHHHHVHNHYHAA